MPISSVSSQRENEGKHYFQQLVKKASDKSQKLSGDNSLRISQNQILTKTALGICLLLTVVDSVEAKKPIFSEPLPTQKNPFTAPSSNKITDKKIALSIEDDNKENALILASKMGNVKTVNALIRAKVNYNKPNQNGETALKYASQNGHIETVEALIKAGADVNASNNNGATSLQVAAENGHIKIVEALIKAKAKIEVKNKYGETALRYASQNGHIETVEALIKAGADVNIAMNDGTAPVYIAAQNGHTKVLDALIRGGADVDKVASNEATPLFVAAENGHIQALEDLIKAGADVNKAFYDGATPVFIAAQKGHTQALDALIKAGADVDKAFYDGATPVFIAAQNGHTQALDALIRAGADVNKSRPNGLTPVFMAAQNGHTQALDALIKAGADVDKASHDGATPVFIAAEKGYPAIVEALSENGADINKARNDGKTPLFMASHKGHIEVVVALIEGRANFNEKCGEFTPLQTASENGHTKIVKALIGAGADVDEKSKDGKTALDFAIENKHSEIIEILSSVKADSIKPAEEKQPVEIKPVEFQQPAEIKHVEPEKPVKVEQSVEEKQITESSYPLATIVATSVIAIATTAISCGISRFPPAQSNEEEIIKKASSLLDPINTHLDKLPLFILDKIETLEWKMKDDKLVLELEHQPENIKRAIRENFNAHIESDIQQENQNKSIITLTPAFTDIVRNSKEYLPQDLNFLELQTIKNDLEVFCDAEFNLRYGQLFFRGLDQANTATVNTILNHAYEGHENSSSFVKLQRLFNFGLADPSQIEGLERSKFNEISPPDFYDDKIAEALKSKFEKDGIESRDSIHNDLRIGARLFSIADEEAKYFVRFPRNPGNVALACKTQDRNIIYFEAQTNDRFEILDLRRIEREGAVALLDTIRMPAPAPAPANGAPIFQPNQHQQP